MERRRSRPPRSLQTLLLLLLLLLPPPPPPPPLLLLLLWRRHCSGGTDVPVPCPIHHALILLVTFADGVWVWGLFSPFCRPFVCRTRSLLRPSQQLLNIFLWKVAISPRAPFP